jgi:aspartyl-tRNA(Asn)/glutamyl-tRNA(Gln) amidotransferase subunit A
MFINMKLDFLTIKEAHKKLEKKEISAKELAKFFLNKIKKLEPKISAFITVTGEEAEEAAEKVDQKLARGEKLNPLEGIPCAIKDNILVEGTKCTAGSKILENYTASYNATVIKRLKDQGAIILGKTNMDEFAMGSSTESSAFKKTKNPWDDTRAPGGSSGGSAASVSSGETIFSLGSDTGGSIRQPAAFCGTVGLKPTYGRVSRYGLMALASSFDQIGPITSTCEDAAWLFSVISGHDEKDATCITEAPPDLVSNFYPAVRGLKLGIPKKYFEKGIDPKIKDVVEKAIKKFKELGAKIQEVSLPHTPYALACYYIIMPAEASINLARYDGIKYGYSVAQNPKLGVQSLLDVYLESRAAGFGPEVKRRIMLGTYTLSAGYYEAYYKKALKVRTLVVSDFKKTFKKVDLLVSPVTPTLPFKLGEKVSDPLSMYVSDILTVSANVAGIPAISLPCGFINGLPVGLQIMGDYYNEKKILEAAGAYEANTEWHKMRPQV